MINKGIFLTLVVCFWILGTYAQYVPNKTGKNKKISSIKVAAYQQDTITQPIMYCDTLIMGTSSALVLAPYVKSFTLYAKYCKFGKDCRISGNGINGKNKISVPDKGEWGQNAAKLNLYLNIYSLEHLIVEANGGNGADGKVPGIYGAGGDINLSYYAPFVLNVSKKYRKRRRKPTIYVKAKTGYMNARKLQKIIQRANNEKANANNPTLNPANSVAKTNTAVTSLNQTSQLYGYNPNTHQYNQLKKLAKTAEKEKTKRKKGKIFLTRTQKPILPEDINK
ncbi:hypothetical protein BKI52_00695 [marine bacterium AO1-C]|nr:hypothetical protein BKI52_00695 [marine bacterium AO1-C]